VFLLQALGVHGAVGHFRLQLPRGPFLFESPTDRTLRVGETSFLNVVATGYLRSDPPAGRWLDYQWLHDGRALPGENFASLLLSRVDVSSAGAYQVVVSDSEGSVTSAVARVVVSDHEMPPVLLSDCARGGIGGATQPPCWTLHGERGRYYVIESSSNLVDWAWQPVVAEGPLPDERFSPGAYEPVRAAAHVLLAEGSFAFRPASVDRSLFLRARRVQPLDEGRLALLWIVDLAKEELARALLPSSAPSDGYSLPDVEPLVPRVVSRVGFSGDNDCHGAVVLGGLAAPTTWPCVPLTLESALDPYWSTAPRPVWNARGSSH
jgi:hypothetical protein